MNIAQAATAAPISERLRRLKRRGAGAADTMGEAEGVRWALISTAFFVVPSIACTLMARRYVRQDVVS